MRQTMFYQISKNQVGTTKCKMKVTENHQEKRTYQETNHVSCNCVGLIAARGSGFCRANSALSFGTESAILR